MNERETFCLGPWVPLSWGARDQGERVGKMVKAAIYILLCPPWGERDSQKLDGLSVVPKRVCGSTAVSLSPRDPPPPHRSQSSTCCSDACSDVALICRTRLSFAAFVRAVGQELLQYYVPGSLSWLRLCLAWNLLSLGFDFFNTEQLLLGWQ